MPRTRGFPARLSASGGLAALSTDAPHRRFGDSSMEKAAIQTLSSQQTRGLVAARQVAIVVAASLFVAFCARITIPLPFTPVPLTVQNFGVLLVGLLLGSKRGFAVLTLYLAEGAIGLPVFNPTGAGGMAQLLGA